MSEKKVAIYGATGLTGRLTARHFSARGGPLVLGGRDQEALESLAEELKEGGTRPPEVRVASVEDEESLDEMLVDVEVVINCAGPFGEIGAPVVESALRTKTHYIDVSGEQDHVRWILENCDQEAQDAGLVLFPSCAFEFALGDLAAEIAWSEAASRIVIAYVVEGMKMSQGTKKSLMRSFAAGGLTYVEGQYLEKKLGYRLFDVPLPNGEIQKGAWVPGCEVLTVPRRGGVSRVETCVAAGEGLSYFVATFSSVISPMLKAVQPLANRMVDSSGNREEAGAGKDRFLVISFDPKTSRAFASLQGEDIYGTTARIAAESALRIRDGENRKRGFVGAADLFEPEEFLQAVGVEVLK